MRTQPLKNEGSLRVQRFDQLGEVKGSWLHARHHFSFGHYYNPERMGFGTLRVVNDDRIKANKGFEMHPHRDMEIITYVRKGSVHHKDSLGNEGATSHGEVQVMSAGTGVFHSEHSDPAEDTTLYQIWIEPNELGVAPRWRQARFPTDAVTDTLPLLVSGRPNHAGKGGLFIHADAALFGGRLNTGTKVTQPVSSQAYLLVSAGKVDVEGIALNEGDALEIEDYQQISIVAGTDSEVVLIDHGIY